MRNLSRIVWAEGMYLGPHHFQAQSRYFEDTIHFAAESLWFAAFGLLGYELNEEALRNGTLLLSHARGVFEDGLAFDMPSSDPLPEGRELGSAFPATADTLLAFLAVLPHRNLGGNTALETGGANGTRFVAEERVVADEILGGDEKPVRFGRKNIRLLLEHEAREGWQRLPIARIRRDGTGRFALDTGFIPPVIRFGASSTLLEMVRRLVEILTQKSMTFAGSTGGLDHQSSGMSAHQTAGFWFLHAVNSALANLRHLYLSKQGHPEELYLEMLRLGGALCTFSLQSSPAQLPVYDHLDLQSCFESLDIHIRQHLELVIPTNCITIKLQQVDRYFWEADLQDTRVFQTARWFLSLASNMGEAELIKGTPALVKVCSAKFVPELVKRALPGLRLTHVETPPSALSPRIKNQYFTINRNGPCWDHLTETRRVGVYIPGEIPNPELELLVLLER